MSERIYGAFHLFCGIGGGALGFQRATANHRGVRGRFRTLGGVDSDALACEDFGRLTGVTATCLDLFTAADYAAFHGQPPPEGWREATPEDLRSAAGGEALDVLFTSPPCRGLSGLLGEAKSRTPKYQALNRLVTRGLFLALEAWAHDPPALVLLENVPRIVQRGRPLLDQVTGLLQSYGYAVAEGAHDCGEIGGLAQHRRRFLLVARHQRKVPPFLYQPPVRRVRSIGEVLGAMPLPEDPAGGPMHRLPRLKWETWVRLALIPAGKDWRALAGVEHATLRLVPVAGWGKGKYRVTAWDEPGGAVIGASSTGQGAFAVAGPRETVRRPFNNVFRLVRWDEASPAVTGGAGPSSGGLAVADPRLAAAMGEKSVTLRVRPWTEPAPTVTGASSVWDSGGFAVTDPRVPDGTDWRRGVQGVIPWGEPVGTVCGESAPSNGAFSVADPRLDVAQPRNGTMRVTGWDEPAATVTSAGDIWAGSSAVADPRPTEHRDEPPVIIALDGTWHRPLTTLELAALQGFPVRLADGSPLVLAGRSSTRWREAVGNAVPPPSSQAVAEVMLDALLQAGAGVTFALGGGGMWVEPDDRVGRAVGWSA